ncbi:MAG: NAD(P)(+) transhydrogenase (Re/Si-specific) subunit alpha [Actinobacteria bacterium]|nr:MAG: NAD(P)(+) transhydrogenase (Re/Si-specific) subunit alpha [Actinomycetota bacterium]
MRIGVPEEGAGQPLVAATPDTVKKLIAFGYEVTIQSGAGSLAHYSDSAYEEAGARIVDEDEVWGADIVMSINAPTPEHLNLMHKGSSLISRLAPARNPELIENLSKAKVNAFAVDTIPRISRAQAMDVLSSQANIAGYRAVIEAASRFGRLFTGQVTAAGKTPPARVYVIGAGVAGLAAIGAAHSMGAEVSATDVRPEVAEQVESMGARFVRIPIEQEISSDGYARQMSSGQEAVAQALYAQEAAKADIVITTANIPGKDAPLLLSENAINAMRPGSIIVDMAAASGGNAALTTPGETTVTPGGVTIIGEHDLACRLPEQSSQLFGQNIVNLMRLMTPKKDGHLIIDLDDEIVRTITVTLKGEVLWPPPPVNVSAAAPSTTQETPATDTDKPAIALQVEADSQHKRDQLITLLALLLTGMALVLVTPTVAAAHYIVLMLAVVIGFKVISDVTPSLHTPLMSVTNAISGIILVGAILQVGSANPVVSALSFVAIVISSINIFGGFLVTHRMLDMFKKG